MGLRFDRQLLNDPSCLRDKVRSFRLGFAIIARNRLDFLEKVFSWFLPSYPPCNPLAIEGSWLAPLVTSFLNVILLPLLLLVLVLILLTLVVRNNSLSLPVTL